MNPLLWAFISLQLSAPLPNVSSWQTPGLDINGPFHHQLNSVTPATLDVKLTGHGSMLYSHWCVFTSNGQDFKCAAWYPRLL